MNELSPNTNQPLDKHNVPDRTEHMKGLLVNPCQLADSGYPNEAPGGIHTAGVAICIEWSHLQHLT